MERDEMKCIYLHFNCNYKLDVYNDPTDVSRGLGKYLMSGMYSSSQYILTIGSVGPYSHH